MIKKIYKNLISEKKRIQIILFFRKLIYPCYLGKKYYCNCCGKSFRKFLPKGNIKRKNAMCPYCLSLERTRLIDLYLSNKINIYNQQNIKILHFAPEDTLYKKFKVLENIEYIDGDINPAFAHHIVDITQIPFPSDYFDYIICLHVLGHVPNENIAISELHRVLKKGGQAFVMSLLSNQSITYQNDEINTPEERLIHYGERDLCRLHGWDLADRLSKPGFQVDVIDYRNEFSNEEQTRMSLGNGEREIIFCCKK